MKTPPRKLPRLPRKLSTTKLLLTDCKNPGDPSPGFFCYLCTAMDIRIGNGYDVHAIAAGLPMWLGGVQIPSDKGFVAHSDGDVAIHALCDALLGCLALGDIGHLFPDTSDEWKGIDSKILLKKVVALIHQKGYRVGNVDITIALQRPKLAPHIETMRQTLAPILEVSPGRVSVKATTTEKLGFVGREEGCEVWASATVMAE